MHILRALTELIQTKKEALQNRHIWQINKQVNLNRLKRVIGSNKRWRTRLSICYRSVHVGLQLKISARFVIGIGKEWHFLNFYDYLKNSLNISGMFQTGGVKCFHGFVRNGKVRLPRCFGVDPWRLCFEGDNRKTCESRWSARRAGSTDLSVVHSDSTEAEGDRLRTVGSYQRLLWHLAGKVEFVGVFLPPLPTVVVNGDHWGGRHERSEMGRARFNRSWQQENRGASTSPPRLYRPPVTEALDALCFIYLSHRNSVVCLSFRMWNSMELLNSVCLLYGWKEKCDVHWFKKQKCKRFNLLEFHWLLQSSSLGQTVFMFSIFLHSWPLCLWMSRV